MNMHTHLRLLGVSIHLCALVRDPQTQCGSATLVLFLIVQQI